MNEAVRQALATVDAAVLVIEARGWTAEDDAVLALLPRPEPPVQPRGARDQQGATCSPSVNGCCR